VDLLETQYAAAQPVVYRMSRFRDRIGAVLRFAPPSAE
jgi:hypothetical protein